MVTADEVVIFSTGIILAYFFVIEIYKCIKNKDWVLLAFILLIVGFVIYFFYSIWKMEDDVDVQKPEDPIPSINGTEPSINENEPLTEETVAVPEEFHSLEKDFVFDVPRVIENQMEYSKFKNVYQTPEFIDKFTSSLRLSLQLKKKRYQELKVQFNQELAAFDKKGKEGLAELLSVRKNEMSTSIRSTLKQIDELLPEIDKRLKNLNTDTVRHNLYKALNDPRNGLETLTGREEIKDFLAMRLYTFAMNPRIFFTKFQNIAIYAGSGYGKTKIAKVLGHVYGTCGILIRGHFIQTTKAGLVSPYVNETAHNTRTVLLSTLESVLFIDEAYDITPPRNLLGHGIDHGHEAITELVNFIDKMIGLNIIIVAGYQTEMEEQFMKVNEGLERRFLPPIVLQPYTSKQLTSILIRFIQEDNPNLKFTQTHYDYIYSLVKWIIDNDEDNEVFKLQAGAMLLLAGEIGYSIHGLPDAWPDQYEEVIRNGFNRFLAPKGISIQDK